MNEHKTTEEILDIEKHGQNHELQPIYHSRNQCMKINQGLW